MKWGMTGRVSEKMLAKASTLGTLDRALEWKQYVKVKFGPRFLKFWSNFLSPLLKGYLTINT